MLLLVTICVECIYVVVGDYICCVHICCWWLYMLNAYMLLVNSFTCYWCCYVGESMYWNMLVWTCEICMKHVLLWSGPSSHTYCCCCCCLSSPIVVVGCCGIPLCGLLCGLLWCVYMHQGRRPRRWKKIGTTRSRVGLDTLYVLRRIVFVYELEVNMWWCIWVLDDCCCWNLVHEYENNYVYVYSCKLLFMMHN